MLTARTCRPFPILADAGDARPPGTAPYRPSGHRTGHRPVRILALCLGGIGDTVLAFAALRDLRRAYPDAHLTALAMWPQSAELLEDLGLFDEVWQHNFQKDRLWRSLWMAIRMRWHRHDVSILAFPANRFEYNVLSRLLGCRRRFGHSYVRGSDLANLRFLLTDRISQFPGRHTVDENRALVALFTGRPSRNPPDIRLGPIDPRYHSAAQEVLGHLSEPLMGVHAGSSTYKGLSAKRWPAGKFGHLCRRAWHELGLQPVIFGAPDEIRIKHRIQEICPQVFFAHGDSIRHTAALIARCTVFVSNDSALAHIATALDVPTVMVCGPTDPGEVGPYVVDHAARCVADRSTAGAVTTGIALTAGTACSPCFRVGRQPMHCTHAAYQACMKQIAVEQVLAAVARRVHLLGAPAASKEPFHHGLGLHECLRGTVLENTSLHEAEAAA